MANDKLKCERCDNEHEKLHSCNRCEITFCDVCMAEYREWLGHIKYDDKYCPECFSYFRNTSKNPKQ